MGVNMNNYAHLYEAYTSEHYVEGGNDRLSHLTLSFDLLTMDLIDVCVCLCVSPQAFMLPLPSCCERNRSPPHRLGSAGSAVALTSRSTSEVMWSTRLLFLCSLFAPLAVGKIQRAGVDMLLTNTHANARTH